jgi:uncharacterized protein (TIGR02147 family)
LKIKGFLMQQTLFQQLDYKEYLAEWIQSQASGGHGMRKGMAEVVGCQTAFISQVLKGNAHFSLEQADKLNPFLGHSKEESSFFLLLVQFTRAGTDSLRAHFLAQIQEQVGRRSHLKERLKTTHELSNEDNSIYFSSWSYAAVHVLLSVPGYQTKAAIAETLHWPVDRVGEILEFCVSRGLAMQSGDQYSVGPAHIHLGNDSSMIVKHHMNWRVKALEVLDQERTEEMHYSSVVSVSGADIPKIKAIFADALTAARKIVADSKEEALYSICLDFFRVNRG